MGRVKCGEGEYCWKDEYNGEADLWGSYIVGESFN